MKIELCRVRQKKTKVIKTFFYKEENCNLNVKGVKNPNKREKKARKTVIWWCFLGKKI